jgi:hypothetical protein
MVVKVKIDGEEQEVKVNKPTAAQKGQSEKIRNAKFREVVKEGAFLKSELKNVLKSRGQWDDDTEQRFKELGEKIESGVKRLNEGGFELEEAKELAFQVGGWRAEMVGLVSILSDMADLTAEGQADNIGFDYLVSACAVYNNSGKPVFSSLDDYQNRKDEDYAYSIASEVYKVVYGGVDDSVIGDLPEYQFLQEYKFVDKKLRRIDEQGRLIDDSGRLIDEDGSLINEEGKKIDRYGNLLNEEGKPVLNRKPFLKNGEPVAPIEKVETPTTPIVPTSPTEETEN